MRTRNSISTLLACTTMLSLLGCEPYESQRETDGITVSHEHAALGSSTLVINEVDYDMEGSDTREFIEIYNKSASPVSLTNIILVLVDGDRPAGFPRGEYRRYNLSNTTTLGGTSVTTIAAGGYLVAAPSTFPNSRLPAGTLRLVIDSTPGTTTDLIHNGVDGIGLVDNTTGTMIDSVFYEPLFIPLSTFDISTAAGTVALNFEEGTRTTAADSNIKFGSIQRTPNATDTDNNNSDFAFAPSTPGFQYPATSSLVISEVDYDTVGTDNAEFIEIYNGGLLPVSLTDLVIVLVDGDNPSAPPRREYRRFSLAAATDSSGTAASTLAAGQTLVAASSTFFSSSTLPASSLRLAITNGIGGQTDIIENGDGDGVGLIHAGAGVMIDAVVFEPGLQNTVFTVSTSVGDRTFNFAETTRTATSDGDLVTESHQRFYGADSNNNSADFALAPPTPGTAGP